MSKKREHAPRSIVAAFALSTLGAVGFALSYSFDLGAEAMGACIGGSFAFLGLGLAVWSAKMDAHEPEYVEEREVSPSPPGEWSSFEKALTTQPIPRSRLLWSMLTGTLGTIGLAALFPLRSLYIEEGSAPGDILSQTSWRRGRRLVTEEGVPVRPDDLDYGGVLSAFPEGQKLINADAATLLIRIEPDELQLPPERREWVMDGVVAYSKLCTHAGCPVGLYAEAYGQLLCPCHHSVFDARRGAQPVGGPAARPLPQLPITTDHEGYLVALGDFTEPAGAGWWGYPT